VDINAYRIYPVAMRCLHVDTRVRVARSHYIVILCTSGPMNMDSLPLHLAGSSSIYAGASSRRSTEPFSPENRGKMPYDAGRKKGLGRGDRYLWKSDSPAREALSAADRHFSKRYDASESFVSLSNLNNIINIVCVKENIKHLMG